MVTEESSTEGAADGAVLAAAAAFSASEWPLLPQPARVTAASVSGVSSVRLHTLGCARVARP